MVSLIINADDLGFNAERDRGILDAFVKGIVTSASLVANGSSFTSAVELVKSSKIPVGVHLNLAEGTAITGNIKGITDEAGQLPGKEQLRQSLAAGTCDSDAIYNEFSAQVQRLIDSGLQPDHIDGHQHCQLFPCLTGMVIELAREYGISAIRSALPAEAAHRDPRGHLGKELALYRQLGNKANATILAADLQTPDGLLGMPLLNRLDKTSLCQLLENIPQGFWELMVHPGYPYNSGNSFDGQQRYQELLALLSPEAKQIIAHREIRLCHFGELSCAS